MKRSGAVHKAQLYCIFAVAVCLVSVLHVLGYVKLLERDATKSRSLVAGPLCLHNRTADSAITALRSQQRSPSEKATLDNIVNEASSHDWGIYQLAINNSAALQSAESTIHEDKLSTPQAMFLDYMRRHSADSLRRETPEEFGKRRFAIAYYSCPHQLGNRFFHFMNNMLWAVITDRTVLYKYLDKRTCEQLKEAQPMLFLDDKICQAANTVQNCDTVLERAPWLPSYDEFVDPSWEIDLVDFWQTHWFRVSSNWIRNRYPFDALKHTNMTKVDRIESKLVEFPALTNFDTVTLNGRFTRQELLETSDARVAARKLTNKGLRFTYGMFFAEMFRLRDEQVNLVEDYYPEANAASNMFSIALHSRHKHIKHKGQNINNEMECLDKVLVHRPENQPCQVCAMSDRPLALETLKNWLENKHKCDLIQIQHEVPTSSFSVEHGPNAGAGFARELDVCHRFGIHAVVTTSTGSGASSSALLEALADYNNNKNYDGASQVQAETQYCNAYSK